LDQADQHEGRQRTSTTLHGQRHSLFTETLSSGQQHKSDMD